MKTIGKGVLFHDHDAKNNQPHMTGMLMINDRKYRLAAWKRTIKSGKHAGDDYLILAISEQDSSREDDVF